MSLGTVRGPARRVASLSSRSRATVRTGITPFARAEGLEQRTLLAAFVVNDAGDSGPGTLRQAILDANTTVGADTITFNLPGSDAVRTIQPLSALPEITGQTSIDGRTHAGVVVELDGSLAGPGVNGLTVGGSNSLIRGLVINRFGGHGVALRPTLLPNGQPGPTPSGIHLELNYIGTDWTGNVALGNGGAGVMVSAAATFIGQATPSLNSPAAKNVISGNGYAGIWVTPPAGSSGSFTGATIMGNSIGTNAAGSRPLGNGREGVLIEAGISTTIGGNVPLARNVISGNASSGIRLGGTITSQVRILNNYIGTDFSGANAIPNGWSASLPFHDGITVATTATSSIMIGAPDPTTATNSSRNLISGNTGAGVRVLSGGEVHVIGNYVGTDATGNADLGNGSHGVALLGGTTVAAPAFGRVNGNLISGNGGDGVRVGTNARLAVPIGGNYIGTNATGTAALGNDGSGIGVDAGTNPVQIGMEVQGPPVANPPAPVNPAGTGRNLVSANGGDGIRITADPRTARPVIVVGNFVGTDVTGNVPLGNGGSGVYLDGVTNSTVGGQLPFGGNLISANGGNGITLIGSVATQVPALGNNRIQSNRIGTTAPDPRKPATPLDPGDNAGLGNHGHGVAIYYSSNNRVGVTGGNVIAYNDGSGVLVEGSPLNSPTANSAVGNRIGNNSIYGNGRLGIDLVGAGEGVTPNDVRDADGGSNTLQNFPDITEAVANATGSSVQIRFTLMTAPGSYVVELFSSPLPDPSGYGEGRTFLGMVTVSTDANGAAGGTFNATVPAGQATAMYYTATATQTTSNSTSEFSRAVRGTPAPPPPTPQDVTTVTGRYVFYNDSLFDGNDPAGNTQDLGAVAPDKQALLPGQTPSIQNVTSYDKGINGIQLMLTSLSLGHPTLTADDFEFKVGPGASGDDWAAAPAPHAVTIIPVPGPNSVYSITWADGAVRNTWLRVTVKANANTGLAAPDVFYFGNLVGETGDASSPLRVSAADLGAVKAHLNSDAGRDNHYDINRDGVVNALDLGAVRANYGRSLSTVVITPPMVTTGTASDPLEDPITAQVLG